MTKNAGRNARVRGKSIGRGVPFNTPMPHHRPGAAFRQSDKEEASSVTPDWARDPSLLPKKPPGRK